MANYDAKIRTNYFSVTDEAKFRRIIKSCCAEDELCVFEQTAPDGKKSFGFGCYGTISGISAGTDADDIAEADELAEPDPDAFYDALQSVLSDGDAIIITEAGSEKLRYLTGCCTVITKHDIQYLGIREKAIELARAMLNNPDFTTQTDY